MPEMGCVGDKRVSTVFVAVVPKLRSFFRAMRAGGSRRVGAEVVWEMIVDKICGSGNTLSL